jgi:hypothetical protein
MADNGNKGEALYLMERRPIDQDAIRQIVSIVPQNARAIRDAIECRVREPDCSELLGRGKLLISTPVSLVDDQIVEAFRNTDWCIRQWRFTRNSADLTVDIQRKRYLSPTPQQCFHVTPVENWESIHRSGILTAFQCGRSNCGDNQKYLDSQFYIHVALSVENGFSWAARVIPGTPVACIPIYSRAANYRLYLDTAAGDETAYIVDSSVAAAGFLGSPVYSKSR